MVKSRRKARELAVQVLYSIEVGSVYADRALDEAIEAAGLTGDLALFAKKLVDGVYENRYDLDERLAAMIQGWDWWRVAAVDRCVLRVGAYELLFCPGIPPLVTINEAIEVAKRYSTAESGKFVNGVLARLMAETSKNDWDPSRMDHPPENEEPSEEPVGPDVEEIEVTEDSPEIEELAKVGLWRIRTPDKKENEDDGTDH